MNSENYPEMPVLFIGHGNPMNALEVNEFTEGWTNIGKSIPKPASILCISAHWETKGTFVTSMDHPRTIHDFSGFPTALYEVKYPAPGDPGLAGNVSGSINKTIVGKDYEWGLDHGCWSVLKFLFPGANIPVIQLSLDYTRQPGWHYELAGQLAKFRKEGILIIGSGNMVHNLRMMEWENNGGYDWADEANEKLKKLITNEDHSQLINYKTLGKEIQLSAPTPEHFLPLLYTLGLRRKNEKLVFFNDKVVNGSISMTSIIIKGV